MKRLVAVTALAIAALPAHAQTWTGSQFANESLLFGRASPPGPSMGFYCTAPAPENRPLFETGSHESHRTEAFQLVVEFFDPLFEWTAPYVIEGIVVSVDETSYQMPPLELNELQGSGIYLPMTDPFILSLFEAERLVFDTGQGTAYEYPVDGLAEALREGMGYCAARWVEMGNPLPPALAAAGLLEATEAAPDLPAVATPVVSAEIPQSLQDAAGRGCPNEVITVSRDQLLTADFDGDGAEDFILNHGGIQCTGSLNLFCGAANCSIDVFMSSQGYQNPREMLGIGATVVPLADGRSGIQISGTFSLCGEAGVCPGPLVWNGSRFDLQSPETPTSPQTPAGPKN